MITLGTGKFSLKEEKELGLAGEHDYAVLDMKEHGSQRLMLVKNPWCDGMVWKGSALMPGSESPSSWTRDPTEALPETKVPENKGLLAALGRAVRRMQAPFHHCAKSLHCKIA